MPDKHHTLTRPESTNFKDKNFEVPNLKLLNGQIIEDQSLDQKIEELTKLIETDENPLRMLKSEKLNEDMKLKKIYNAFWKVQFKLDEINIDLRNFPKNETIIKEVNLLIDSHISNIKLSLQTLGLTGRCSIPRANNQAGFGRVDLGLYPAVKNQKRVKSSEVKKIY